MKKIFAILLISSTLAACGGSGKSGSGDSTGTDSGGTASTPAAPNASSTAALKLIDASDCNTCHNADTKVIGPAFKDIAAKYPATEANIDTLVNKVIKGGSGNWGTTPMLAHPNLSQNDAKTIVKYILSLKK
jgi:cytochrome c